MDLDPEILVTDDDSVFQDAEFVNWLFAAREIKEDV